MRSLGLLLFLLSLSLALPTPGRADTGWSTELRVQEAMQAAPAQAAALAPTPPSRPAALYGALGSAPKALLERGERENRSSRDTALPRRTGSGPARFLPAVRSRIRSVEMEFLNTAPLRAAASMGIVGFHTSPPPPHSLQACRS